MQRTPGCALSWSCTATVGKASRDKGKRGERELAQFLRDWGLVARRGRQFSGSPDSPDVVSNLRDVHLECKRRETLSLYPALEQARAEAAPDAIPIVCHRRNHKPWVAILELDDLLLLLFEAGRM